MDLLERERIQPDMSDGMNSRWVMGNRRNSQMSRSAGRASGAANLRRRRRGATTSLEDAPIGQPWKSVRPSKVAKAKVLSRDRSYPSRQVMESVAELLAERIGNAQQVSR